jgi:hypothetical protein
VKVEMDKPIIKVFTGRTVVAIGEDFHEVELFDTEKELVKGYGYIRGNYVYIYRGRLDEHNQKDHIPGIYKNRLGEITFIDPESEDERNMYSVENIVSLDVDRIFQEISTKQEDFVDPDDIEVMNSNRAAYKPVIKEEDDFLKYIVKKVILEKEINLKNYRTRFTKQYALNNMKNGLERETKMTVTNFKTWCEVLGIDWEMHIADNGSDKINPLPKDFTVKSDDF